MIRTTITYSDAHSRVCRIELTDDDAPTVDGPDSGWYVDGNVVAFQRTTTAGKRVTTMIPLGRVLRIETTETLTRATQRILTSMRLDRPPSP